MADGFQMNSPSSKSTVRGLFLCLVLSNLDQNKIVYLSYLGDCVWSLSPLVQAEVKFFCRYFCLVNGSPLFFGWDTLSTSLCGLQTKSWWLKALSFSNKSSGSSFQNSCFHWWTLFYKLKITWATFLALGFSLIFHTETKPWSQSG